MVDVRTEWTVNESLLQSYRGIFISSQAFMLAVGTLSIDNKLVFLTVAGMSLLMIWYIWYPVVRSRHLIVDYYKYARNFDTTKCEQLGKVCTENEYVRDRVKRKQADVDELLGVKKHWRLTRVKMDLFLPILFSLIWIVLIGSSIWT